MDNDTSTPEPAIASTPQAAVAERAYEFWQRFGQLELYAFSGDDTPTQAPPPGFFRQHSAHRLGAKLPAGMAVFTATSLEGRTALGKLMSPVHSAPPCSWESGAMVAYLVAIEGSRDDYKRVVMPEGVVLKLPGDHVALPADEAWAANAHVTSRQHLSPVSSARLCELTSAPATATGSSISLVKHSLRGQGAEFEARAVKAVPLLGRLVMAGQATAFFAPPNAGKTLITLKLVLDAISDGSLNPENVFYINADDNSEGFALKLRLLEDAGAHVLAPGHKGFKAKDMIDHLKAIGSLKGGAPALIVIDTLKKFTSLMDKGSVSEFAQACRLATMNGATIVGFAHTNKNVGENGKLRYGGTTDLIDDFDAAYLMTPLPEFTAAGERVVRFENIKARGANVRVTAYAYAGDEQISYAERLASVREVNEAELDAFAIDVVAPAIDLVPIVKACITERDFSKMALAKEVAKRSGASEREALRVVEQHTGTDPDKHLWAFTRKARGAQVFRLLESGSAQAA